MLGVVFFALALLIGTISALKKSGGDDDDNDNHHDE